MGYAELLETRDREFVEACKILCHAIREINKPAIEWTANTVHLINTNSPTKSLF